MYAILRAPRSPSTEAIVLSSPYRTMDSPHGSTLPGIALMIALAKHFSSWSKCLMLTICHELSEMFSALFRSRILGERYNIPD